MRSKPRRALTDTEDYWLNWAGTLPSDGDYHAEINESLVVLKAMTYAPTGGIVAAPTTSLPESIGGARNWDYRFCWLRDATLTLLAMLKAGSRARPSVEPVALARGGRRSRRHPDHVRTGGRASPGRARARLVARIRGVGPGTGRQRGVDAAPARRLRRDARCDLPAARRRRAARRQHLVADAEAPRVARGRLASTGHRRLGDARPAAALHALQGHGVGGVRPRGPFPRRVRARGAGRALAGAATRDPRRRPRRTGGARGSGRSRSRTDPTTWTRASC